MTKTRTKIAAAVSLTLLMIAGAIGWLATPRETHVIVIPAVQGGQR
jgi:hypothetical protein